MALRELPLISIITVNYNGLALTVELLNSIRRLDYKNVEVFVVDNASKDNPQNFLIDNYPELNVISSSVNLGFAGGNNLAITEAKGHYLFFVNNDAEIATGCLEKLVSLMEENPRIGAVSPMLCYYNDNPAQKPDLIQYVGATQVHALTARNRIIGEKEIDKGQFPKPQQTAYAHGAAMLVRKEVITHVGMMFEDFFLYYEELDWCERIRKKGYEIWVEPRAKVYHKESVTVGVLSPLKTYYLNRNRIFFMRRQFSRLQVGVFCLFLIVFTLPKNLMMYILRGEYQHAKVFIKAIIWNLKDSLRSYPEIYFEAPKK